ncbi:probable inactive nicotinamidase At3g16190 isoform X2 [Gossypium hirsutum]|uniref:Probable inactive nicotinamidase At3g16190 isoform X2 n=1 Tax=Gossypium hirsutum TaxID=3635 RepID=A0ABM2ZST4_GOSHI|nr:probable inactive nicotinamidase At3g16190 isoform X2 [Gossypium hirsutum]XP_040945711.1 probable inactive nicotinamidase At3g16190 isoform X2 [Gossypium hirsutum]
MAEKWKHTALLVIDMQNDFILDDGLMRVNGGKAIVPNVIKAVEIARQRGILIVWVVREHDYLGRDVELFRRHLYTPGKEGPTTKGYLGAQLVDGLVIKEGDYKLVKTRFSAFFATHLHSFLRSNGVNNLVVVGVQTPNCIRQTVFDAVAHNYQPVTVIVDATAAATADIHDGVRLGVNSRMQLVTHFPSSVNVGVGFSGGCAIVEAFFPEEI